MGCDESDGGFCVGVVVVEWGVGDGSVVGYCDHRAVCGEWVG